MLHLRENNISYLPEDFGRLVNLKVLDIAENNLQFLPLCVKDIDLMAIWLSENQNQPLVRFTEESILHEGEMKPALMCYMLPQMKKTQEILLRRSVIYSDDQPVLRRSTEYTQSRLSVTFNMNEAANAVEVDEDYGTFSRKNTPHPKQLKELEATAKHLVKDTVTIKSMVSSSSTLSKADRVPGVHESIDEAEEEEEEDFCEEIPEVEIIRPLDCIDKELIPVSPRVKLRTKKTPQNSPQVERLSLIELTQLTREMGNSLEQQLGTTTSNEQLQERRKLSDELDDIISTCHAHLTGMIDEMEATISNTVEVEDDKKESMTSLIVPSEIDVQSHYNSYRTSIFTERTYASSLSSLSDDDDLMCLHISDDESEHPVVKESRSATLSRRSSRVKSLNRAHEALDDAIKLLAENITNRVMDEAKVIMRAEESTQSLDSAYETSLPRTPTDSFNSLTDQIAQQIVGEAIRKAQDQIKTATKSPFGVVWRHYPRHLENENENMQKIANEIVVNAIATAKQKIFQL